MNKIIIWILGAVAVLALIISIGNSVGGNNQSVSLGGITNYDTVQADKLLIGTSTVTTSAINASDSGTSTLSLKTSTASRGSCIEMQTAQGGTVAITVNGTTIGAVATTCR